MSFKKKICMRKNSEQENFTLISHDYKTYHTKSQIKIVVSYIPNKLDQKFRLFTEIVLFHCQKTSPKSQAGQLDKISKVYNYMITRQWALKSERKSKTICLTI